MLVCIIFQAGDGPGECEGLAIATDGLPSDFEFPNSGRVFPFILWTSFFAQISFLGIIDYGPAGRNAAGAVWCCIGALFASRMWVFQLRTWLLRSWKSHWYC